MKLSQLSFVGGIMLLASVQLQAQNSDVLSKLTQSNATYEQTISTNQAEISKYEEKLQGLNADLQVAEEELKAAQSEQRNMKAAYRTQPTAENKRAADSADATLSLAEHKVASASKRVAFSTDKIAELKSESASARKAIDSNKVAIAEINQAILAQERREAEEQKKAAQVAAAQSQKIQATAPPVVATPVAAPVSQLSEADQKRKVEVQSLVDEINTYLASGVRELAEYPRLKGSSSIGGDIEFEHLGGEIYRGQADLVEGDHKVKIGRQLFLVKVRAEESGSNFTFYFDNRSSRGSLTSFRTSLLAE